MILLNLSIAACGAASMSCMIWVMSAPLSGFTSTPIFWASATNCRILHRCIEGAAQDRDPLGRHIRRQHDGVTRPELHGIDAQGFPPRRIAGKFHSRGNVPEVGQAFGAELNKDACFLAGHPVRLAEQARKIADIALDLAAFGGKENVVDAVIAGDNFDLGADEGVGEQRQRVIVAAGCRGTDDELVLLQVFGGLERCFMPDPENLSAVAPACRSSSSW